MNWIHQAITNFGQTLGIPGLAFDEQRSIHFALENGGRISIHHLTELPLPEILIVNSRPLAFDPGSTLRRALHLPDFKSSTSWAMQAAIKNDQLVLAMRIPERSFALDALEQSLAQLTHMHRTLSN
jgi:type III secretion system chaperone SycN